MEAPHDGRAPFLPERTGDWATFVPLEACFQYHGSGVMPGRTWVIAPDVESLARRWDALKGARGDEQAELFHPHGGGDRTIDKVAGATLPGIAARTVSVRADSEAVVPPVRYGFRTLDRQWIVPDVRLINRPNPTLWASRSDRQVFLTAPERESPSGGPALSFSAHIPDLDHYRGRGGRAFPLYATDGSSANISPALLDALQRAHGARPSHEDVIAYIAGLLAHPGFVERFAAALRRPGLRVPFTGDTALFAEAVALGREVVWCHTYGERFADPGAGRPAGPPRLTPALSPKVPAGGSIPSTPDGFPDTIEYDPAALELRVGAGRITNVTPAMWAYEVSGKHVVRQWFSYRKRTRERPLIGDRRPPSRLGDIQPDHWLASYTTELLDLLHVLGRLIALEPRQAEVVERILAGPLVTAADVDAAAAATPAPAAAPAPRRRGRRRTDADQATLLPEP